MKRWIGNGVIAFAIVVAALTMSLLFTHSTTYAAYPDDAEYIGNSQCKVCHNGKADGEQWNVWSKMNHAKAYESLQSDAAKAIAKERGLEKPAHESAECLKCHVTGYDAEKETFHPKLKAADAVQCESCHGPGSLHAADGKALKFKKGDAGSIDISAHITKITESGCVKCHNEESPTWNPEKYTTESGEKKGFDFKQAYDIINHPNPKKAK